MNNAKTDFLEAANGSVDKFEDNNLIRMLDKGKMDIALYHCFLNVIFHQVKSSSSTFALAAANCDWSHQAAKSYLFKHAEEEKDHWKWILNDLASTNYSGRSPNDEFPPLCTQAYISFNYMIACTKPIARLGIAYVLEGIGAKYGKRSAEQICKSVSLSGEQTTFLFGHGDTDVGHQKEILAVLEESNISDKDWAWLRYSAQCGGELYKNIYEEISR